jgi:hypothetical protein
MKDFEQLNGDSGWRAEVAAWSRHALAAHGISLTGEMTPAQVRPWSVVLTAPTTRGTVYFKAAPEAESYEARLAKELARLAPEDVPFVYAVDTQRGWWLGADGGENIRAKLKATRDLSEWQFALTQYAQLQRQLMPHVDDLLALDVPDRRPRHLPTVFDALLKDAPRAEHGDTDGLTPDELTQLDALRGPLADWCARVEASPIPMSLNHGDLNSGNVLQRDGHITFVDWGDASITHPFVSMRTPPISVENVLELPDEDPYTRPLRETYLAAWSDMLPMQELRALFCRVLRISPLVTAQAWARGIGQMTPARRAEYAYVIPSLLREFLNANESRYPYS